MSTNTKEQDKTFVETVVDTVAVGGGRVGVWGQNRGDYIHRALSRPRRG